MDWKEKSVALGVVCFTLVIPTELRAEEYRHIIAQASELSPIQDGTRLNNQVQPLPLPQPNPNLNSVDQTLDQSASLAEQQSAVNLIRQTQDAGLLNDDYVGSPAYFNWADGEQMGVASDDAIGTWGDGYYPYTADF